jgi:hypothetical protein
MYRTRLATFLYEKVRAFFEPRRGTIVPRVIAHIPRLPKNTVGVYLGHVDEQLTERIAGEDLLGLADAIEAIDPAYISAYMPMLERRRQHLARAREMADLFQVEALDRLIVALEAERNGAAPN